jgi:hypothetical protein
LSKKAFQAARDTANVLIAQVKASQPVLMDALEAVCANQRPLDRKLPVVLNADEVVRFLEAVPRRQRVPFEATARGS